MEAAFPHCESIDNCLEIVGYDNYRMHSSPGIHSVKLTTVRWLDLIHDNNLFGRTTLTIYKINIVQNASGLVHDVSPTLQDSKNAKKLHRCVTSSS